MQKKDAKEKAKEDHLQDHTPQVGVEFVYKEKSKNIKPLYAKLTWSASYHVKN